MNQNVAVSWSQHCTSICLFLFLPPFNQSQDIRSFFGAKPKPKSGSDISRSKSNGKGKRKFVDDDDDDADFAAMSPKSQRHITKPAKTKKSNIIFDSGMYTSGGGGGVGDTTWIWVEECCTAAVGSGVRKLHFSRRLIKIHSNPPILYYGLMNGKINLSNSIKWN